MEPVAIDADAGFSAASARRPRKVASYSRTRAFPALAGFIFGVTALAIVVGMLVRLSSLDRKLVFQDEAYSFVRVSGYFLPDLARFYDGRTHRAGELAKLQEVIPARGIDATVRSLAEEPGRAPLYYLVARIWVDIAGGKLSIARALSAIFGIAGIGIAFLLARRLTGSSIGGAVAATFTALSPMLVRYSQQFREYILVADLSLLSTWLLLRALDRGSRTRWMVYGLCVAAGIYTSVTFAAAVIAQGCAVAVLALHRSDRTTMMNFACAAAAGLLSYVPWLLFAVPRAAHGGDPVAFASEPYSLGALMIKWAFNLGAIFFDSEFAYRRLGLAVLPLLALIGAAFWHAATVRANLRARLLVLGLAGSTLVPLTALDMLRGSHLQGVFRYSMPSWTGIELMAVLLVTSALTARKRGIRAAGLLAYTYVACCGFFSVFADRPYDQWWDNNEHLSEQIVAREIRLRGPAIILASGDHGVDHNVLVLSRYLPRNASLLLSQTRLAALPRGTKHAYLFLPTAQQRRELLASLPSGTVLANVSPSIGLSLPDLRSSDPYAGRISTRNALWQLSVP